MKAIVLNKLYIKSPTPALLDWVKTNLTYANPEYAEKERLGKWIGNTPKEIALYERNGDILTLPFGVMKQVYRLFARDFEYYEPRFNSVRFQNYDSNINLYDYQENAVIAAIRAKNGIIVMPCGAGKTQTALELAAQIGGRCLWLTHTQDLLNQSMERAQACFDLPLDAYGTITEGKINVGKAITFATVQTMASIDLAPLQDEWDIIIVDECHKCVGAPTKLMMFYKVVSSLTARYKFGITATPKRADGLERSMFALLGEKIYEVSREEVAANTVPVEVVKVQTGYRPNEDLITAADGTIVYSSLVKALVDDRRRNATITDYLAGLRGKGAVLVLTDRLAHIATLAGDLAGIVGGDKICAVDGTKTTKAAKAERKEVLRRLDQGDIQYLFATYKLAKEGLDVPNLRYVVFATPQKDYTTVAQSAGRVSRRAEGKDKGIVVDFVDDFGLLYGYAKKRNTVYKQLGYTFDK